MDTRSNCHGWVQNHNITIKVWIRKTKSQKITNIGNEQQKETASSIPGVS